MRSVEIIKDGGFQILIRPEDAIDVMILEAMATRAEADPTVLKMFYRDGVAVISVEIHHG